MKQVQFALTMNMPEDGDSAPFIVVESGRVRILYDENWQIKFQFRRRYLTRWGEWQDGPIPEMACAELLQIPFSEPLKDHDAFGIGDQE